MKTVSLTDFLSLDQIKQCFRLYPNRERILAEVVIPNMTTIDRRLGQENDPKYISHVIVFACSKIAYKG